MKLSLKTSLSIVISFLFLTSSLLSVAADFQSKLGVHWGTGNVTTDLSGEDPDLGIQESILYEYKLDESNSLSTVYTKGSADFCFITCFSGDRREAEWKNFQINFKKKFEMTKRWSPFGRIGANYYESKFKGNYTWDNNLKPEISESGFNYVVALGLQFEANNGFFIGFEAQHMPMDIISTNTYNVFGGFSF